MCSLQLCEKPWYCGEGLNPRSARAGLMTHKIEIFTSCLYSPFCSHSLFCPCSLCLSFWWCTVSYSVFNRKGSVPSMWQPSMVRWRWPVCSCRRELHLMLLERWGVFKKGTGLLRGICLSQRQSHFRVFLNVLSPRKHLKLSEMGESWHSKHMLMMTLLNRANRGSDSSFIISSNR